VFFKIVSKVLVDKGILGGRREKILFFVFTILGFIEGDMGEGIEAMDGGRGNGGTGNNVLRAVGDVEKWEVFNIIKSSPDRSGRWGILELGGLRSRGDGLEDMGSDVKGAWVVPSIVRALKDLKDGSGGICNVLLIGVVKGGPGSNRDMGEGKGGDNSGLRRSERHFNTQLAPL